MLSNKLTLIFASLVTGLLFSCTPVAQDNPDDDYRIGEKLESKSSLTSYSGDATKIVALYDSTISKIQLFDLENKKHIKTLNSGLDKAAKDHFLLYNEAGNYVVELTQKGFSLIKSTGEVIDNPIKLLGMPTSASFRPEIGLLVIQDDANSIGILKISNQGDILKSWVGGSKIDPLSSSSLASGDINENGELLASLTDGQILKINLESTLTLQQWIFEKKGALATKAKWVATLQGQPDRILLRTSLVEKEHTLILYDLMTQSMVESKTFQGYLENSGRFFNPHVVINDNVNQEIIFITTDGNQLFSSYFQRKSSMSNINVISSVYDKNTENLSYVQIDRSYLTEEGYISLNAVKEKRTFKKIRMTDYLLISEFTIPNNTTIDFSSDFVFSLYPNKTGYATVYSGDGIVSHEFKFFNRKFLKK
ncbi:MAG: hypothetical protein A2622_12630 [Bdellovibrionales bacterium RIFCSPHIGHO2_01_FULL_40_29]|nr:MAG: hypothetical protein A2622_12630 [Bdellovibrionales bacterium RIFCSPHIGHO2_01_FULL_40_29]OFZ33460.1 MAG: hypothetical protein A3D17_14255 [Bdellovibrionales bacterium RIFCSPHIGHO2_02_FULL_40_15]